MTEREEFELVAKAAGYDYRYVDTPSYKYHAIAQGKNYVVWNPKTDDGNSRRLAVDLGIDLVFYEDVAEAYQTKLRIAADKLFSDHPDKYAAVKAAVWDVAVEVAKRRIEK